MYQQITIIGNVGRDPELRYTAEGIGVCSFSVAVNQGYGDNQKTVWFRVSAWRKLAETCNEYVHKGMQVLVIGTVEARAYMGKDDNPACSLEVTAQQVKFLSRRDEENRDDYHDPHHGVDGFGEYPF